MSSKERIPAIALSVALVLSLMGSGIAMATDETSDLSIHVEQDDVIEVTVAENGTGVDNATVDVAVTDENDTYAGTGSHVTDANGTVDLPVPEETVDVTVTAEYDGETVNTSASLNPALSVWLWQAADGSATVNVFEGDAPVANATVKVTTADGNATYDGAGEYETAEDGTVVLPAPAETVDVTVTATYDNETADTSATLEAAEERPELSFGQQVSAFVHGLLNGAGDENTTIGQEVAEFVTSNNPGNASDHAGPKNDTGKPEHAGPGGDAGKPEGAGGDVGKPAQAGSGNETGQSADGGSPENRGNGDRGNGNAGNGNGGGPP